MRPDGNGRETISNCKTMPRRTVVSPSPMVVLSGSGVTTESHSVLRTGDGGDVLQKYVATAAAELDASVTEKGIDVDLPDAHASEMDRRKEQVRRWARHCATFRTPNARQAIWQIVNSAVPLAVLLALMFGTLRVSYVLTLILALPAGGLLVRLFIIQHDCGHGSYFGSSRLNTAVGRLMSVFTLAPYALWRREHAIHHNGSGNLERRGIGDIETKTVAEYLASTSFERWRYRLYRNPLFLFGFGVPFYFLMIQRLPWFHGLKASESWRSVMSLNVAVTLLYGTLGWLLGFGSVALIALPVLVVASALGGWLFFIQHQFEETRWDAAADWDFQVAAIYGSSHYVLPKPLQWLTGNIGLHHIHHLNSMVPNYRLQECMDALPELAHINRLTITESLHCPKLTLWDETKRRLVSYREATSNATAAA